MSRSCDRGTPFQPRPIGSLTLAKSPMPAMTAFHRREIPGSVTGWSKNLTRSLRPCRDCSTTIAQMSYVEVIRDAVCPSLDSLLVRVTDSLVRGAGPSPREGACGPVGRFLNDAVYQTCGAVDWRCNCHPSLNNRSSVRPSRSVGEWGTCCSRLC